MPGTHRDYLRYLERSPRPIRDVAKQSSVLREAYNAAVSALKKFRDMHIRIACLYIVTMSKTSASRKACPMVAMMERMKREEAAVVKAPVRGTGGNELSQLLKAGRDATKRAVIN